MRPTHVLHICRLLKATDNASLMGLTGIRPRNPPISNRRLYLAFCLVHRTYNKKNITLRRAKPLCYNLFVI